MAYRELLRDKNEHCELLESRIVTVNTILGRVLILVIGREQWCCMVIGKPEMIARNGLSTQQTWIQSNKLHWALDGEKKKDLLRRQELKKEGLLARKRPTFQTAK